MATTSRTPNNATITVSPAKLARAPRGKRPPAPTIKVRENQALRRTRRATRAESPLPLQFQDVEESDGEYEEETEDTANTLEELLGLVRDLKKTIDQQNRSIQEAQTELKELKEEQQHIKEQNIELKDEIGMLRDQVGSLSASLPSTPSWASVATNRTGSGSTQQTSNGVTASAHDLARSPPDPRATTDTLYCTIDTSRVADEDTDKTAPGAVRAAVEKEMRAVNGQGNWRCRAVTRDAKNANRIKIACRDEAEQHMVKQVAETKIALGTRVLRDELYPVKVDNVNRLAVLDADGEIKTGAAEAFSRENETTVSKISWLSKKNVAKAYGSMVVYLTKGSDATRLLREGFFHVAGESGYTGIFERRPRPEQCFNCQELGHKAFQCKNAQKCARCAQGGHRHNECTETMVKCVPCGGPHESFSRNCRKLYPVHHE
jgi:regulator of replication initiation timing